ncbi:MAG: hypothetical protein ACOCP4_04410 [Candidatus Woesearchaeota archaeon]
MMANLSGDIMEVNFPKHFSKRVEERVELGIVEDIDASEVKERLVLILEIPAVADFVMLDIKVGDSFAICDYEYEMSFALRVHNKEIDVLTVFNESNGASLKLFEGERIIEKYKNDMIIFAAFLDKKKVKL